MPILVCSQCGSNSFDSLNHGFRCQHCGTVIAWDVVIHKIEGEVTAKQPDFLIRAGKLEKYTGAATEVVIPDNVTIIGAQAFDCCSALTRVSIPSSVSKIEYAAFRGCSSLTSITLPNSITSIGDEAFDYCSSITRITIPDSVRSIGIMAFSRCSALSHIVIPSSVKSISAGAFRGCSASLSFILPPNIESTCKVEDDTIKNYIHKLRASRRAKNQCVHCGGTFQGFWSPKCTQCGRAKDY